MICMCCVCCELFKLIEHHIRLIKIINRVADGLRNHFQFKCFHFQFTISFVEPKTKSTKNTTPKIKTLNEKFSFNFIAKSPSVASSMERL